MTLRWGILGTGFISRTVIEAIQASDASQVAAIAGRDQDKANDLATEYDIEQTGSFDDVINDPDIDVLYIGLPNHQHHPYVIAGSATGKAVLSEKSLTTTLETAHELIDAVAANQTFFVEGLMYLSHPVIQQLVDVLSDGRIGALRSVTGRYGANIAHLVNPAGQGTIYNLGCYPVSLLHLVLQTMCGGDAFSLRTTSGVGNQNPDDGTVCDAALSVRFDNGVLASIQASDNYGNTSEFAIAGDHGVLRFETNPWLPIAGANIMRWEPYDGEPEQIASNDDHDAFYHQVKMVERNVAHGAVQAARPSPRWQDSLEIMSLLTEWEAQCLNHAPGD